MKRLFSFAAVCILSIGVAVIFGLSACSSTGQIIQMTSQTPEQITANICPPLQSVMGVLAVPGIVDPAVAADLAIAAPIVAVACDAGHIPQVADLQVLSRDAVPVLLKVIQASPLSASDKEAATLGIAIVQAALAPVLQK